VNLAGGGNSQRQFNAGAIAGLFGVEQLLETGSARLRWFQQDDSVCAFVETDGGSSMTTFEREADLRSPGLPACRRQLQLRWRRRAGVRGGRSRQAHDRAGDAAERAGRLKARRARPSGEPLR